LSELGRRYALSRARISQIESRAIDKLRRAVRVSTIAGVLSSGVDGTSLLAASALFGKKRTPAPIATERALYP
jgi:transcription initiation factor TFIIIB Brf1 subunit/transcription initiation factor TFIIB